MAGLSAPNQPGANPLAALAHAIAELDAGAADTSDNSQLTAELAEVGALAELTPKYLLVIDQFEELFEQSDAHIAQFATQCLALLQARRFYIVATMRADCYASLLEHAELAQLKDAGLSFDVRAPSGCGPRQHHPQQFRPRFAALQ